MASDTNTTKEVKNSDAGLTPLMQQHQRLKAENPNAILLFRCGDFYETFFDDAVLVAKELQITLTARGKNGDNPIPLAGVPYHAIDGYLKKLVQKNYTVAICEQLEDPKKAKGLVKRDIVRIITPGTLSDPNMLEGSTNNYLTAFGKNADRFCIVSADISTGEVIMTTGDAAEYGLVAEEFTRLMPREILVLNDSLDDTEIPPWKHINAEVNPMKINEKEAVDMVASLYPNEHKARFISMPALAVRTLGILADHLFDTQRCSLSHLSLPKEYKLGDGMVLDEATLNNLELLPNSKNNNIGGTLFDVLNKTKTSMGARMFKKWLLKPLTDKNAIEERLQKVDFFIKDALLLAEIRDTLKGISDLERILGKVSLGSRNPRDLQGLNNGLLRVPELKSILENSGQTQLASTLKPIDELTSLLTANLNDDLPPAVSDGGVIKTGINEELDGLRSILRDGKTWMQEFEEKEKQATGIKTLKVGKNTVFGYYIEVSKGQTNLVPERYIRKQTLTGYERYITAELKDYENKVFTANEKILAIEKDIFESLVAKVIEFSNQIKENASAIAEIDVISSLAQLASDTDFCRPTITDKNEINIKAGRHPVVEKFLSSGEFHPNDLTLNDKRIQAIITGPNMAGKSTYLRQTALIVLMAQIGSYVPAESAEIGVVDRIFTRVGASDNLLRGQSTFMVEMMETSAILKNATKKSLLIVDEIGRGTSTFDGLSLAWSILEYINMKIGARTLFATHYHELTDLDSIHEGIFNLNVGVKHDEKTGNMVFLHEINEGPASKSYGIEVARLAGLPSEVLDRAKEILFELEKTENDEVNRVTMPVKKAADLKQGKKEEKPVQLSLFFPNDELADAVKNIDLYNITPLEAMNILAHLKELTHGR
ncbi:MAG: DNA mismatch repair protein MutS [Candidatus Riflebacteria bacterium]|nr:DNA mismatch repair protein MutS [Candidatus Riflebacteria bacterium]